jgi:hypothetical protein
MGEGSFEKYQDESEATLCKWNSQQVHKPNNDLLLERFSASKTRITKYLSAYKQCIQDSSFIKKLRRLDRKD